VRRYEYGDYMIDGEWPRLLRHPRTVSGRNPLVDSIDVAARSEQEELDGE
jgi:hypothetical protein